MNLRHALAVLAGLSLAPAVAAAQAVDMKIADTLPSGHVIHRHMLLPFIEEANKALAGKVTLKHFPGGQLGKPQDMLTLTQTGVVEIGFVGPSYISDKMPHMAAVELPGLFPDYCKGIAATWKLTHGGILDSKDFASNGIVVLLFAGLPTYQIQVNTDRSISTLRDLAGLKVRTSGGAMEFLAKNLGMVPVRMAPPEIYEALSRGTIDGYLMSYQSTVSYTLDKLVKRGTSKANFGTIVATYSIAKSKLDALPADVRQTLMDLGEKHTLAACSKFETEEKTSREKVMGEGLKLFDFTGEDERQLKSAFEKTHADWVENMEKRGKAGKAVMDAVLATIK